MGRRLCLSLTHKQIRVIHDQAVQHASELAPDERQLWIGIAKETKRALDFHERSSNPGAAPRRPLP